MRELLEVGLNYQSVCTSDFPAYHDISVEYLIHSESLGYRVILNPESATSWDLFLGPTGAVRAGGPKSDQAPDSLFQRTSL